MRFAELDKRPVIVAVAGPNGAGKTTFHESHLRRVGLRLISPDVLVRELDLSAYAATNLADALRRGFVKRRESFVFETVFSDPVGAKLTFLKEAAQAGYTVVVCFIGIADPEMSEQRVAMRVSQGGHDVPRKKLRSRFPRTLSNLVRATRELNLVVVFDNSDLDTPFRQVAVFKSGKLASSHPPIPAWLKPALE